MQILKTTMMKSIFPSKINWGRFSSLLLFFASFHIVQAVSKPEEAYLETDSSDSNSTIIFISKEATVSGLEYLHISRTDVKKVQFITVKKTAIVKKRIIKKTEIELSGIKQKPQKHYKFRNTAQSDILLSNYGNKIVSVLGIGLFSFKCVFTDAFKLIILVILMSIFLINYYNSKIFFGYHSSKNFQRPPPVMHFHINTSN